MRLRYTIYTLLLLLLFPYLSNGQTQGKPFLRNYVPKEYQGHVQNWAITQDPRGVMFFGNGNGMMTYDGSEWRITDLPNQVTVRSMAIADNGLVYVGISNGFGYWGIDEKGNGQYIDLTDQLPDSIRNNISDVWETHTIGNTAFFRTYYVF